MRLSSVLMSAYHVEIQSFSDSAKRRLMKIGVAAEMHSIVRHLQKACIASRGRALDCLFLGYQPICLSHRLFDVQIDLPVSYVTFSMTHAAILVGATKRHCQAQRC